MGDTGRGFTSQFGGAHGVILEGAAVEAEQVLRKLNSHLIPWLFSLGILCYLDRTNLAFASIQLSHDLGLSCSTYGIGAGIFFIAYAACQVPSQLMLVRFGAPLWLGAMAVLWGLVAVCFAFTTGKAMFLALRLLLGMAESTAFPGFWYHLSLFYSPSELGPAYAKVATCTALAQVIGAPIAAAILSMDGLLGLRGWQWLFICEGLPTVLFGAVLRLRLAASPATARCLSSEERAWLQQRQAHAPGGTMTAADSKAAGGSSSSLQAVVNAARDWRILWLGGAWLLIAASMYAVVFWCPLMVSAMFSSGGQGAPARTAGGEGACSSVEESSDAEQHKRHSVYVALLTAVPFAVAAGSMVLNAGLAERANERHRHAGIPIALGGLCLALLPLCLAAAGPVPAFICLVLAAGAVWAFHGPFMSWPAAFLSGAEAAAAFALINSMGAVGGFLGPFLVGLLADRSGGYTAAMLLLAGFLAVAALAILAFPVSGRRDELGEPVPLQGLELKQMTSTEAGERDPPVLGGSKEGARQPQHHRPHHAGQPADLERLPILSHAAAKHGQQP